MLGKIVITQSSVQRTQRITKIKMKFFLVLTAVVALVSGHGRVLEPAGRGSLWRVGYNARANYDDDALYCGGFYHQHSVNGGKCGLCGDPYDEASPRAHERGGIYDSGIIAASYEEGSVITITVEITAHHLGYWIFKLCPDGETTTQECFDEHPLELEEGGTKYYPNNGSNKYYVNYRLPEGLTCENCVLQWRYICGNNWGFCEDGTSGLGCGDQENFGACSDITITPNPNSNNAIVPDSLLLKVNEIDIFRLIQLVNSATVPQRWTRPTTPKKQRLNSKKPHSKGTSFTDQSHSSKNPNTKGANFLSIHNSIKPYTQKNVHTNKSKQRKKIKRKKKTTTHQVHWMAPWR